jgi:hypothetical protein
MYSEEQLKGNINSIDRQLLYDIRELMRENNLLLTRLLNNGQKEGYPCKYCGETHENRGQLLACAKKHKRGDRT